MIEGLIGVLSAIVIIMSAKRLNTTHWLYSITLISLPLIYMGFAIWGGDKNAMVDELVAGIPFILVGATCLIVDFRTSGILVALLWIAHAGYDVFHDDLVVNSGVPNWYPLFCAGIDVVVGCYLLYAVSHVPGYKIKRLNTIKIA